MTDVDERTNASAANTRQKADDAVGDQLLDDLHGRCLRDADRCHLDIGCLHDLIDLLHRKHLDIAYPCTDDRRILIEDGSYDEATLPEIRVVRQCLS